MMLIFYILFFTLGDLNEALDWVMQGMPDRQTHSV